MSHTLPLLRPIISLAAFDGASLPLARGSSSAPLAAARAVGLAIALAAEVVAVAAGLDEGDAGRLKTGTPRHHPCVSHA